ncbi:MAG TPA: zeta toxin family protein [Candidatus Nanopelagicales bacterium]
MTTAALFMQDLDDRRVPLSAGMIARWMMKAGMGSDAADGAAARVVQVIEDAHADLVASVAPGAPAPMVRRDEVFGRISDVLLADGLPDEERRVRIRRWMRTSGQPIVIAVGGSSGVGKSTVSLEAADRLGISVVISTDQVRAVIRSVVSPDLLPALSQSSFSAAKMLRSNLTGNRLLFAFEEQARIVQHGTAALARRSVKEGQQVVVNGVHIVPGLHDVDPSLPLFTYVLTVGSAEEHRGRFIQRFLDGDRKPTEYLQRMDAIRELDEYIVEQCHRHGVQVITSTTFEGTVLALMDAAGRDLEARFDTHPVLRG